MKPWRASWWCRLRGSALTGQTLSALLLVATFVYLYAYLGHPHLPGTTALQPFGWWSWADQHRYLVSARALSQLDFTPRLHWYPLGYPLMGALFHRATPVHTFFFPNLACFLGIVVLFYRFLASSLTRLEAVLLVAVSGALPLVLEHLVIPWTTIPSQLGLYATIYLLVARPAGRREFILAALVAGGVFLVRPSDVTFLLPVFAGALLNRPIDRHRLLTGIVSIGIVLLCVGLALILNKVVFGVFWQTPYVRLVHAIGFGGDLLAENIYSFAIEARTLYDVDSPMMLARYPWALFVLPGMACFVRQRGWPAFGLILSLLLSTFFYLSFHDFDAASAFRFLTIHYLLWTIPLLAFFAYLTVTRAWSALGWKIFVSLLVLPSLTGAVVGVRVERLGGAEPFRVLSPAGMSARLTDGNRATAHLQFFPTRSNVALDVQFAGPTRVQRIAVAGWPDTLGTHPQVEIDGRRLQTHREYRYAGSPRGLIILLRRERTMNRFRLIVAGGFLGPISISEVSFSRVEMALGGAVLRWIHGR